MTNSKKVETTLVTEEKKDQDILLDALRILNEWSELIKIGGCVNIDQTKLKEFTLNVIRTEAVLARARKFLQL